MSCIGERSEQNSGILVLTREKRAVYAQAASDQQADDLTLTRLSDARRAQLCELLQEARIGLIVRVVVARHAVGASFEASGEVVFSSSPS